MKLQVRYHRGLRKWIVYKPTLHLVAMICMNNETRYFPDWETAWSYAYWLCYFKPSLPRELLSSRRE